MKHIGFCGADGPEVKSGTLRLTVSDAQRTATATLLIAGETCVFRGRLKGTYDGAMTCPGRRNVPMMLSIE